MLFLRGPDRPQFKSVAWDSRLPPDIAIPAPIAFRLQDSACEAWRAPFARGLAATRIPEIADEFRRRGLVATATVHEGEHAGGCVSVEVAPDVFLQVDAGIDYDKPYHVFVMRYLDQNRGSEYLVKRRSVSFEGLMQMVDDFLAGFRAAR